MKCLICGADVPVGRFVYCSAACARQADLIRLRGKQRNKHKTPAEAVCPICGKVFEPKPNEKYCSYECKNIARNRSIKLSKEQHRTGYSVKKCEVCGEEFKPVSSTQKSCPECASGVERLKGRKTNAKPAPPKSLAEWCKEANECNLDYGNYRALIEHGGKTFEELRAQAATRCVQFHAHGRVHSNH